jgi:hypothetical protein
MAKHIARKKIYIFFAEERFERRDLARSPGKQYFSVLA